VKTIEFFCTVEDFLILKKLQSLKKLQKVTETVLRSCAAQIVILPDISTTCDVVIFLENRCSFFSACLLHLKLRRCCY